MPTIFITLIYFMAHLRYTAAAFFSNFFTVIVLGLVSLLCQTWQFKADGHNSLCFSLSSCWGWCVNCGRHFDNSKQKSSHLSASVPFTLMGWSLLWGLPVHQSQHAEDPLADQSDSTVQAVMHVVSSMD